MPDLDVSSLVLCTLTVLTGRERNKNGLCAWTGISCGFSTNSIADCMSSDGIISRLKTAQVILVVNSVFLINGKKNQGIYDLAVKHGQRRFKSTS